MISMTDWTAIVKTLGSKKTKTEIRDIIIRECLFSTKKFYGAYLVNGDAVWEKLIESDPNCAAGILNNRLENAVDVEGWFEKYQAMRYSYPRNHHKKGS